MLQEVLYDEVISQEFDRIIPVVGDEGVGKSTFMLQFGWFWQSIIGEEATVDNVIDRIVWDSAREFKEEMSTVSDRQVIIAMDATRVMHKKESMHGEHIDLEKDLFDVRTKEIVFLLGYQDWSSVPTVLQDRRAKNMFYIPTRGSVWGYNRDGIDRKLEMDKRKWPEPQLKDTFAKLDGTKLWTRFKKEDKKRKDERIKPDEEEDDETDYKELAQEIIDDGLEQIVSIHQAHNRPYVDQDLIEIEYDLTAKDAKKVKKLVNREVSIG